MRGLRLSSTFRRFAPPHPLSRTPDGEQVLRLCFQSANRGKQLHATLVAPDGSGIATIDMSEGSKSLRSSVGEGIKALAQGRNLGDEDAPYPSILVSAVGQEFGSFVGGTRQSGSGAADSGKWSRKDGTGGAVLLEPELDPVCSCFGGGCAVYRSPPEVSREESVLGKKEIPMVVAFVAAPSGAKPVADKVDPSQLPAGRRGDDPLLAILHPPRLSLPARVAPLFFSLPLNNFDLSDLDAKLHIHHAPLTGDHITGDHITGDHTTALYSSVEGAGVSRDARDSRGGAPAAHRGSGAVSLAPRNLKLFWRSCTSAGHTTLRAVRARFSRAAVSITRRWRRR